MRVTVLNHVQGLTNLPSRRMIHVDTKWELGLARSPGQRNLRVEGVRAPSTSTVSPHFTWIPLQILAELVAKALD